MAILALLDIASYLGTALNILYVALGLGLVIFFHELGHFAVAKWCDVHVERFSIGFGPILWSRKKGETEYALSAIPFGGYVKMLGQDDMDPSQLTSEEIAEDPRSYSAKSVPQRMAIISAGVTMNVITAVLFFAFAFGQGVRTRPSVLGAVQVGFPAWQAGLSYGDQITRINGREASSFSDIQRGVALSSGEIRVEGVHHRDRSTFDVNLAPNTSGPRRIIGVLPTLGLEVADRSHDLPLAAQGTPAAAADPPFQPGDVIRLAAGTDVESFAELQEVLAQRRSEPLELAVKRKTESGSNLVTIRVDPRKFRTLGLWMDIGRITAVRSGSPAAAAGIRVGDKILSINGQDVGTQLNPLKLPDVLAAQHGQETTIVVSREVKGAEPEQVTVRPIPDNRPGWIERPLVPESPLSAPALGIAYQVIPTVLKVEPGSPAEQAGIVQGERIKSMRLKLPPDVKKDIYGDDTIEIKFAGDQDSSQKQSNWAHGFWMMQEVTSRQVELVVSNAGEQRTVTLDPSTLPGDEWYVPDERGLYLQPMTIFLEAHGLVPAVQMGLTHTYNTVTDIYLTLRNLVSRQLSVKELHGPLGIATVAYAVAQQGLPELLLFLGFLSVNLAVLNFLPIPVLDGGHMLFLCWEAVTRRRPSERVLVTASYFGMAFVLGLMALVIYLDLFVHGVGQL